MVEKTPGWWLSHPSEKYEFVSWDDDIPNIWKNKIHVPNHQPDTSFQQVRIIYIECVPIEHGGVSMAMP